MLCSRLTVEFSPPWWVGTLERWEDGRYEVGRVVFGAEPPNRRYFSGCCTGCPGCAPLRRWKRLPAGLRHRTPSGGSVRLPGSSSVRPERRPGQLRQRDGKPKSRHAVSRRQRSAGRQPGTVPAAPAGSGSRSTGDTDPRLPGCAEHPGGDDPCRGCFLSPAQKFTIPCLYPCPKTRMIIEVLLLKGSDYHGNL